MTHDKKVLKNTKDNNKAKLIALNKYKVTLISRTGKQQKSLKKLIESEKITIIFQKPLQ